MTVDEPSASASGALGDRHANPLAKAHVKVQEAERARLAGKLAQSASICAELLKQHPDYVAALHTMGLALADQAKYRDALGYLHRASMLLPDDARTLVALSGVYLRLGAPRTAATTLERSRQIAPDDVTTLATLGEIYREEKEYELSKDAFEAALRVDPSFAAAEIGLALNLVHIGQLGEACAILEKAVHNGARDVGILYNLSQMPASLVSVDLVSLIDEVAAPKRLSAEEFGVQAAFARAAILDQAKRCDEAWAALLDARRVISEKTRKGYESLRRRYAPLLEMVRGVPPIEDGGKHSAADLPISLFITAPSRSGKTTLENLFGSLPGVKKGYENPIVENAVRRCFQESGFPTRSHLIELPIPLGDMFRGHYGRELKERASGAKILTNTIPARLEDAARAANEIPNARFVFIKRDRFDTAIRIFMRSYREGNYHAARLPHIFEYLDWCDRMIDTAASKMPHISRVLTYEGIVADPRSAVAQVAELCGIDGPDDSAMSVGDDSGCSEPYRGRMEAALNTG